MTCPTCGTAYDGASCPRCAGARPGDEIDEARRRLEETRERLGAWRERLSRRLDEFQKKRDVLAAADARRIARAPTARLEDEAPAAPPGGAELLEKTISLGRDAATVAEAAKAALAMPPAEPGAGLGSAPTRIVRPPLADSAEDDPLGIGAPPESAEQPAEPPPGADADDNPLAALFVPAPAPSGLPSPISDELETVGPGGVASAVSLPPIAADQPATGPPGEPSAPVWPETQPSPGEHPAATEPAPAVAAEAVEPIAGEAAPAAEADVAAAPLFASPSLPRRAPAMRRAGAFLIDLLLLLVLPAAAVTLPVAWWALETSPGELWRAHAVPLAAGTGALFVLLTAGWVGAFGRTPGDRLAGVRVTDRSGGVPGFGPALLRALLYPLAALPGAEALLGTRSIAES